MSAQLTLAGPAHLAALDALVAACHSETGVTLAPERRTAGLADMLEGSPHAAAYLVGPARSPIGYVVVSFGWSLQFGGLDGSIDEIYVRPRVRGRGIASEVLRVLPRALADAGLKALHLDVDREARTAQRLYGKAGFAARPGHMRMSRAL